MSLIDEFQQRLEDHFAKRELEGTDIASDINRAIFLGVPYADGYKYAGYGKTILENPYTLGTTDSRRFVDGWCAYHTQNPSSPPTRETKP